MKRLLGCFGPTAPAVRNTLSDASSLPDGVHFSVRDSFPTVTLELTGDTADALEIALAQVRECLGSIVFSTDGRTMEECLGDLLAARGETISAAESCTGGLVAHLLTEVAGSSRYFLGSAVTYSNAAKESLLGVAPQILIDVGAVHERTVQAMAVGARRAFGATYAVATSGIAGPDGGSDAKPVGTVCLALAAPHKTVAVRRCFSDMGRQSNKALFAVAAMDLLRRHLQGFDPAGFS